MGSNLVHIREYQGGLTHDACWRDCFPCLPRITKLHDHLNFVQNSDWQPPKNLFIKMVVEDASPQLVSGGFKSSKESSKHIVDRCFTVILRPNLEEFSSSRSARQALEVGVAVCNFQGIFEVVSKNCILGWLFQTIACPCLGMMQSDACICSIDFCGPTIRFRSLSGSKTTEMSLRK